VDPHIARCVTRVRVAALLAMREEGGTVRPGQVARALRYCPQGPSAEELAGLLLGSAVDDSPAGRGETFAEGETV
jgi:hypothetical protein